MIGGALVVLAAGEARATTLWWDTATNNITLNGGNGNWDSSTAMWATTSPPVSNNVRVTWGPNNDAVFAATDVGSTVTVANVTVGNLNITSTKGVTFLDGGAGAITLNNGFTNTGSAVTFNNGISLGGNQTWYLTQPTTNYGLVDGAGYAFTKDGAGTLVLGTNFLTTGSLALVAGTVVNISSASSTPFGTGNLLINSGTLSMQPTGTVGAVVMSGANAGVGTKVTYANIATLEVKKGACSSVTYTAGNAGAAPNSVMERSGSGVLQVHYLVANALGSTENFVVNGGVATNPVNGLVSASIVGTVGTGNGYPADFLTYDSANGFKVTTYDAVKTNISANVTFAADRALAAMKVYAATATVSAGVTLWVTNGPDAGLILDNALGVIPAVVGSGTLNFGDSEAIVYVRNYSSTAPGTLGVNLAGTAPLTKFGSGTLVLSNARLWPNNMTIHTGGLTLSPTNDWTYSKNITGAGFLIKSGPNTLTLTGTNAISLGTGTGTGVNAGLGGGGIAIASGGVFTNLSTADLVFNSDGSSLRVTGNGSVWNQGGKALSLPRASCRLTVDNGGVITNLYRAYIGYGAGYNGSSLVVSNGGKLVSFFSASSYVGNGSDSNSVWIGGTNATTGDRAVWDIGPGTIAAGNASVDSYNTVTVTSGGTISNGLASSAITVGGGAGAAYNSLTITNGGRVITTGTITIGNVGSNNFAWVGGADPDTGAKSLFNLNDAALLVGGTGPANANRLIVDHDGVVTNIGSGGLKIGYDTGAFGNSAIITNGGQVYATANVIVGNTAAGNGNSLTINNGTMRAAGGVFVGYGSSNNSMTVTANGWCDMASTEFRIGGGGTGNTVVVSGGAVVTNVGAFGVDVGYNPGGDGNSLTVANGGRFYSSAGGISVGAWCGGVSQTAGGNNNSVSIGTGVLKGSTYNSYVGFASASNSVRLYGNTVWDAGGMILYAGYSSATGNVFCVDSGATVTNLGTLTVGQTNAALNNSVFVTNGGTLAVTTLKAGLSTAVGSLVQISGGSLLEANTMTVGTGGGNLITNSGGVYQFTTAAPAITNNGPGTIALNNGAVSFRNVTNANVKGNWTTILSNMTFTGANAFRLNNSTNGVATNQDYTFNAVAVALTNYAGLEMVNGNTAYTNGNVSIGSAGWLTFSNTVAVMRGAVTNTGVMNVVNSTVTFNTNLVLIGGTINWTTNSPALVVKGTLTLANPVTLNISPTPGPNDQITLFTSSSAINGSPANWTVTPGSFKVAKGPGGTNLVLRPAARGFVVIVE